MTTESEMSVEQWLAIRKEAAKAIDPETAEVSWIFGVDGDPYGIRDIPDEFEVIARQRFARAPGSDIWVAFDDLARETEEALCEKHQRQLFITLRLRVPELGNDEDGVPF